MQKLISKKNAENHLAIIVIFIYFEISYSEHSRIERFFYEHSSVCAQNRRLSRFQLN